jgi:bifunctional non-homologous end joining protein LigD
MSPRKPTTPERALAEYRRKRDFAKTPEPGGASAPASARPHALQFVVQKHAASHLHFDFRLEMGGVMKSWAIPKGPSLDPAVRRLAVQVEDHPIAYNTFEGTIPAGEYGGGTVMLWDRGTYAPTAAPPSDSVAAEDAALRREYESGRLDFTLHGERLRGAWALVRTRGPGSAGKPQWLLIKRRDAYADPLADIAAQATTSVATGRSMAEIAGNKDVRAAPHREARRTAEQRSTRSRGGRGERRVNEDVLQSSGRSPRSPRLRVNPSGARSATIATGRAAALGAQLEAIEQAGGTGELRIARGRTLEVSSLDKVFFPHEGYTKGDVMRYYAAVQRVILPALAGRPLVLKRSPEGLEGETFFQQKPPEHLPAGVRIATVESESGAPQERVVGGDLVTLLYLVQYGCISMDPWLSRVGSLESADYAILDLDPGPDAPFARVVEVALQVRAALDALGLHGVPKTSGSRGVHIALPLPPRTTFETARRLAQVIAERVAASHPHVATVERALKQRAPDAVYVDFLQNAAGKSVASAYCVRAKPGATVSTPLEWNELDATLEPHAFTIETVPARIAERGDLWGPALRRRNSARALRAAVTA